MNFKYCKECDLRLSLDHFYKHKQMQDGYLNFCKECVKARVKKRESELRNDPNWVEQERERGREKYHRLGYKNSFIDYDKRTKINGEYRKRFPEKHKARNASQRMTKKGLEIHHWSYQEIHWRDIFYLTIEEHALIHRFLVYDQPNRMYKNMNNELLDTREKHLLYINKIIESHKLKNVA